MSTPPPLDEHLKQHAVDPDELSPTVMEAARLLYLRGPAPASALANEILRRHPEYAGGRAREFTVPDGPGTVAGVGRWLSRVRQLFAKERAPQLHGRLVLLGLARMDASLRFHLEAKGIFSALVIELKEPLSSLLTAAGVTVFSDLPAPPVPAETSAGDSAADEAGSAGMTFPLSWLFQQDYARRFDRNINNVLGYAAVLGKATDRPVDSVAVLAAIIGLSSRDFPTDTGYFLKQTLESTETRPRDGSQRGSLIMYDLFLPSTARLPLHVPLPDMSFSIAQRDNTRMSAELPNVMEEAARLAGMAHHQQAFRPRYIIGAILSPTLPSAAGARLYELGFDFQQLREALVGFLETQHGEHDRLDVWRSYLHLQRTRQPQVVEGEAGELAADEEAGVTEETVGESVSDEAGAGEGGGEGAQEVVGTDVAPVEEAKEVEEASVLRASVSDQPVAEDRLGFGPYVRAMAEFLTNEKTVPPLTLSVEGEWGSGKSSFMLQLERELKDAARRERWRLLRQFRREVRQRKERIPKPLRRVRWLRPLLAPAAARARLREIRCPAVRFNAWRHDKEDALWASFALEFVRQLSRELPWPRRLAARLRLMRTRFDWASGWLPLMHAALTLAVLCLLVGSLGYLLLDDGLVRLLPASGELKFDALFLSLIRGSGVFGGVAFLIFVARKLRDYVGNPLSADIRRYVSSPDYSSRVAFIENFHEDFRRIVETYAGRNKVYVFVDDLDRCDVPKAAELMQALNLMIADSPHLVFIIGMDREKVAAGLAVKHEKLLPYLSQPTGAAAARTPAGFDPSGGLEYGYSFIEKFIQLPFRVPLPDEPDLRRLLDSLSPAAAEMKVEPPRPGDAPAAPPLAAELPAATTVHHTAVSSGGRSDVADLTYQDAVALAAGASQPQPAAAAPLTAEQQESRRLFKLGAFEDSREVRDIIIMVAPMLDNNPRRLKQFINLFRLNAYIVAETSLNTKLTLPQLGKWVALGLRWPRLLAHLEDDPRLLRQLHQLSVGQAPAAPADKPALDLWGRRPELLKLLSFGCVETPGDGGGRPSPYDLSRYGLQDVQVSELLRVSSVVPPEKARLPAARDARGRGV